MYASLVLQLMLVPEEMRVEDGTTVSTLTQQQRKLRKYEFIRAMKAERKNKERHYKVRKQERKKIRK